MNELSLASVINYLLRYVELATTLDLQCSVNQLLTQPAAAGS